MKFVPRLYTDLALTQNQTIELPPNPYNYLAHVLRLTTGDAVLLFNGRDGEWQTTAQFTKRGGSLVCAHQTKPQPTPRAPVVLAVSPLKPEPMRFLYEKATELGVTDIVPILTDNTSARMPADHKLSAYVTEAAEQCERLAIPTLHAPQKLSAFLQSLADDQLVIAAVERSDATIPLTDLPFEAIAAAGAVCLIGPEGGFSDAEKAILAEHPNVECVTLGQHILRAETAAITLLAHIHVIRDT